MNDYECDWTDIFMRPNFKMECSIHRGEAKLKRTFHPSPIPNICTISRMKKHTLFALYDIKCIFSSFTTLN